MPITFSDHAKEQLKRRKITQKLVISVIKDSKEVMPSFRKRKLRRISVGDKILEVVTVTEGSKITVITGYYIEYENTI